jgi:hypothetical protein
MEGNMNLDTLLESSIQLILSLQNIGDGLVEIMKVFTFMGDEEFYFILFPILFWCVDSSLGFRAGLILLLSSCVNAYFKWLIRLPRPYWISNDIVAHTSETSFGAPSGHAQNSVAMWGLIAAKVGKPWAWVAAILLMFMIGISRLVMGVHFLLDVILGWIIGAALLWIFLKLEPSVEEWMAEKSFRFKLFVSYIASMALILIAIVILSALSFWEVPNLWTQNALLANSAAEEINPLAISGVISNAGILFGVSAGYIIMNHQGGFSTQGKLFQQILKYIIGIIGVLVIWMGLDMVFPEGETFIAYVFRYFRYFLTGVWISLGAPWIFIKAKLSKQTQ